MAFDPPDTDQAIVYYRVPRLRFQHALPDDPTDDAVGLGLFSCASHHDNSTILGRSSTLFYTAGLDVLCRHTKYILPRDQEGYGRFEYTDEKLLTRHIQWCGVKFYIFFFGELFLKN